MKVVVSQAEFDSLSDVDRKSGWFVVDSEIDKATSKIFDKDKYIDIKHLADVQKAVELAGYKVWTEFDKNSSGGLLQKLTREPRKRYEAFIQGFLYFYDHQLYSNVGGQDAGYLKQLETDHGINTQPVIDNFKEKLVNGLLDHKIFFLWIKGKDDFPVKIFLNPPPGNPDPPGGPAPPPPDGTT